jgi:hypothetical protein
LDLVKTEANSAKNTSSEYRKIHPLGKIPAFEGANGFNLSEAIAIAIYGTLMTTVLFEAFFRLQSDNSPPSASLYMMRFIKLVIPVRTTVLSL